MRCLCRGSDPGPVHSLRFCGARYYTPSEPADGTDSRVDGGPGVPCVCRGGFPPEGYHSPYQCYVMEARG